MTTTHDVIVVGGGLAGLAAGATAAKAGAKTLVLEGHDLGGRARCVARDGYVLNMGGHALYMGSTGAPVLRRLGIKPAGSKPPLSRYRALRGGEEFLLPTSPRTLLQTALLGARGKAQFGKLLMAVPRLDHRAAAGQTVAEWIESQDVRPEVAEVLGALVRIGSYSAALDELSADAALWQLQAAASTGVLYLDGGWDQLTDRLRALVDVRPHAAVSRIEPVAGRIEVETPDGVLVGRSVVVAAGPPAAVRSLLPADPGWGDLGEPVTAACLDAGVSKVPSPGYVLGIDVPIYGTTQSPPARHAPEGGAVVAVIRYGARSAEQDKPEVEDMLRRIGVADEDVVVRRFMARMIVAGTMPRPATGGLAGRPGCADTGVPGVYMAGDWVGPDGLLADAALASAEAAARLAVQNASRSTSMVA